MQSNIFLDITKGKNMDSKDKIIQEQKERIITLNEEIQRLHALLSEAGIPYEKKTQENVAVQSDLAVKDAETEQVLFLNRSLRNMPSTSIPFSKVEKMYTVKEPESRIQKPERRGIILNAGIIGNRASVPNMKKRK